MRHGALKRGLILSRFTGASHELPDALIVNPYDTDELAQAIHTALTMSGDERRARMARMRAVVKEHNIYRWAGNLIGELAEIRLVPAKAGQPERRDSRAQNNVIRFKTAEAGRTTREIEEELGITADSVCRMLPATPPNGKLSALL